MSLHDDIIDALFSYRWIPERIEGLQKERAEIIERLLPKAGASLVGLRRAGSGVKDPTGESAARLAEHPLIGRLGALIAYWGQRRRLVDRLLEVLTDEEMKIIKFYYLEGLPEDHSDWPKMNKEGKRKIKKAIMEKAKTIWLSEEAGGGKR